MSIWRLLAWQLMGNGKKSSAETTRLVHDVLLANDFKLEDLLGFNAETAIKNMDKSEAALTLDRQSMGAPEWDGWKTNVDIKIQVPLREKCSEGTGKTFTVPDLAYRPLVSVIRAAFTDPVSQWFHLTPFKHIWKSPVTGREQHFTMNYIHPMPGTKLTTTCKSSGEKTALNNSAMQLPGQYIYSLEIYQSTSVHLPAQLPESITDFLNCFVKSKNHMDLLMHCKRELFHAVWKIILDDEFVEAYKNGIVIKCHDRVLRRVFPQIFTYSADYPEKVLIATICDKGLYPCPRCLLPKSSFHRLGSLSDLKRQLCYAQTYLREMVCAVRRKIYELGNPIKGTVVERILKDKSLVPTLNAFAERLTPFSFNIYPVLVMDLMHEFELGVLKSVIKHLIRILYIIDPGLVSTLNQRFSAIPLFGIDGICRFPLNVAEMRQWVARHFEDMLQKLAAEIWQFQKSTCDAFKTHKLPSEVAAQHRWQEGLIRTGGPTSSTSSTACPKSFNILTYKFHALGDYSRSIQMFGTTDSYTTQTGELAHHMIKKFYRHTNKRDVATALTKQERRRTRIQRQLGDHTSKEMSLDTLSPDGMEESLTEYHHVMHALPCNAFNLASFLRENESDPAIKNFVPKMKDHLLSRLYGYEYDGDEHSFTDDKRNDLRIVSGLNQVIESTILRVNYTIPNAHPFWYCQVIRAFHISVLHVGPNARSRSLQIMELLWVRWLGVEPRYNWGLREARLPKVGFVPDNDDLAFGFLDPLLVIRGCHLIPCFSDGHMAALLRQGASVARHPSEDDDWCSFYVNIFADRDMFCHFAAIGVGHEIQYPMQPTSSDNEMDEGDEPDSGDDEDDCPTATQVNSRCGMDDSVASPASNGWNSDENNDEEFERDEDEDEDEDDLEDGGDMGDDDLEDVRY
ncbi:hypothetical protein SCLCIDRAFT_25468 [Scleroderma citrinum Foug A]|uniref:Uncharacterized protein n=1 Tax=Scleroderma citrinum Foug A TaxID=1036808 RepID=A0A0C3E133_9AGAM|nr:hypothetical protein SCLCIDRAFT_25468 [Scleroderma citrinum Foug A]